LKTLLANENFPLDGVKFLRQLGYDVCAIGENNKSITDKEVMALAIKELRLILTFDQDYGELIFKLNYKPDQGVVYLRLKEYESFEPGQIVDQILRNEKLIFERTLTVVDENKIRQRRY
jgi:predicted nuclease of predicted toxin-antitoxin system